MSPAARRFFGCALPALLALGACLSCALVAYASQAVVVRRVVTSAEMAPELSPGVTVFVDNTAFWARNPLRGEIVWLDTPEGRVFRRVLAIPGDEVAVAGGRATVNGIRIDEPYAQGAGAVSGPVTLDEDTYFVLADDRSVADSRAWGPIRRRDIFGSAAFARRPGGSFEPIQRAAMPEPLQP